MWIEPISFVRVDDESVVLSCRNSFCRKRVLDCYGSLLQSEINKACGAVRRLSIVVADKPESLQSIAPPESDGQRQLALPGINVRPHSGHMLRRDFTFEHFVVGSSNDYAYSAALSLASQKMLHQNARFLLSKTGLGKSHLSQAIGHHILSQSSGERVYYITAEDFTNEMICAIRNGSIDGFKEKYRSQCDVLLLEDVHFVSGKEKTQTELALTLDALLEADKRLIFTSSSLPGEIPKINDNLRSRLSCGLISNIEPPSFKTRVRILEKKAFVNGYTIPQEVMMYLAGELRDDVRQLESALIGVNAKSQLLNTSIDLPLAESVVKNIVSWRKSITVEIIKKLVCKHYSISVNEIVSRSRKQCIVRPRQIAIYLARRYTDASLQAIGKSFNRYHATALHAIGTVEREIKENGAIQRQVEFLCRKLDTGQF